MYISLVEYVRSEGTITELWRMVMGSALYGVILAVLIVTLSHETATQGTL